MKTFRPRSQEVILATPPSISPIAFHGVLAEIVTVATRNSEAAPVAVAANVITRLCATIGHRCSQNIGDGRINARPFLLLVGQSAKGRKGTSESTPQRIFQRLHEILPTGEPAFLPPPELTGLSTGEGLIFAVRDPSDEVDADGEVKDAGVLDKRLLVSEPEFGNVLAKVRRNSSLSVVLRSGWDGKNLASSTRTRPLKATAPYIVVIGHVTGQEFIDGITTTSLSNGFLNRFLLLHVQRGALVALPQPTPQADIDRLAERLRPVVEFCGTERIFALSPDAAVLWKELYRLLQEEIPGTVGALMARAEAHVLQLGMIFALLDCTTSIGPEHLNAAMAWVEYAKASAEHLFQEGASVGVAAEPEALAAKIMTILRQQPSITRMDLYRHFSRHVRGDQLDAAVAHLLDDEPPVIVQRQEKTGGRPRIVLELAEQALEPPVVESEVKGKSEGSERSEKRALPADNVVDDWHSPMYPSTSSSKH